LSSLDEQVEAESSFPVFFDAIFADFTLTADNNASPEDATNGQSHVIYRYLINRCHHISTTCKLGYDSFSMVKHSEAHALVLNTLQLHLTESTVI